jgi:phosphinothricin acetyltransferase
MQIRATELADLPGILDILNNEIAHGYAHFGTEPTTLDALTREFETAGDYPWVSAAEGESILGFARAHPWKARGGYRRTCEVGVYVRPEAHGRGIASSLYGDLLPRLRDLRFRTLLGGIALPNEASVRLHEKFGFTRVGTLPSVGWKQGGWRDVGYWALVFEED